MFKCTVSKKMFVKFKEVFLMSTFPAYGAGPCKQNDMFMFLLMMMFMPGMFQGNDMFMFILMMMMMGGGSPMGMGAAPM